MKISVIIPTYNEAENIKIIVPQLSKVLKRFPHEIIIVDDNSPDGTMKVAKKLSEFYPVKVVMREKKMGLSSAIIDGFKNADGNIYGVIDADLQHPPELIIRMVSKIIEGYDLVIASRYVEGGKIEGWSLVRRFISKIAIRLAKPLTNVKDPLSGFFMLKKSVIDGVELQPKGFKLLLEILVKGNYKNVVEIPYTFKERKIGKSKLNLSEIIQYLKLLIHLYNYSLRKRV